MTGTAGPRVVHVSAAVVTDGAGRTLLVRKRGTERFMAPGGKPEPGETAAQALARELHEELGAEVAASELVYLGRFESEAANEPGFRVVAEAFAVRLDPERVAAAAEIAEARWLTADEAGQLPLAPLSTEHLLPLTWR
ncbi:NUDIX hydrolase [Microbacterium imperiale]|uniref:DNA mismatch repair protein MutT n=1 Tax=Microbacterium imperiale TaxID=33884 RepID=A0A9W6M228_9MICO|nr:NUDIX domain-containing protein [Microbacterium imperiale]MBP2420322.1 ADP-ribose pyrophosphatase YjhB (NUDIX family) [Microbacterium imperiale]MDS0197818.1 NUDIX domain-containing protein [Microbacterium imperiale]BFE40664.1 NUDIX domain-containing protein [Microbacterium imperiale]GLJ78362.1 DNA mismatch repair protein MutT [Microbacterium imperiale]